jgi:hypothetical protein
MQRTYNALLFAEANFQQTINSALSKLLPNRPPTPTNNLTPHRVKIAQRKLNVAMQAMSKAQLTLTKMTQ